MSSTTRPQEATSAAPDKVVRLTWRDGLGFDARSELGGRLEIVGDDDKAGLRPTEAILVALGSCTGADVAAILRKKRQPVSGYVVEVSGIERVEHPKVFTRIDVLHRLDGEWIDPEAVRRSIELSVTRYCPVTAQLASGDAAIAHHYRIGDGPVVTVAETGPHGHLVVHADGDV